MKTQLQQAGLWSSKEKEPAIDITTAWKILSRLGYPFRYGGRGQDGSYEYIIVDPFTGRHLATGRGMSPELSMCDAAINIRIHDTRDRYPQDAPDSVRSHQAIFMQDAHAH